MRLAAKGGREPPFEVADLGVKSTLKFTLLGYLLKKQNELFSFYRKRIAGTA